MFFPYIYPLLRALNYHSEIMKREYLKIKIKKVGLGLQYAMHTIKIIFSEGGGGML